MLLGVECGFKRLHGLADGLCVAAGAGCVECFGSVEDGLVALAQGGAGLLALLAFALEGFVYGFAEGVPEFLLLAAVKRYLLGFLLPALLELFDGVNTQAGGGAQVGCFFGHLLAQCDAGGLYRLQGGAGLLEGGFPEGLEFGKGFFAQVACFAPAAGELE